MVATLLFLVVIFMYWFPFLMESNCWFRWSLQCKQYFCCHSFWRAGAVQNVNKDNKCSLIFEALFRLSKLDYDISDSGVTMYPADKANSMLSFVQVNIWTLVVWIFIYTGRDPNLLASICCMFAHVLTIVNIEYRCLTIPIWTIWKFCFNIAFQQPSISFLFRLIIQNNNNRLEIMGNM